MILMMPDYLTKLKSVPAVSKTMKVWDESGTERLKGCFACTDWSVFTESCDNLEEINEAVTEYINFCEDNVLDKKTVKCFGNNKPWVTKELKQLLNDKKRAFMENDKQKRKSVQKEINNKIKECQNNYKNKLEAKFKSNDSKGVWQGMKNIVGYNSKQTQIPLEKNKEQTFVDDLNTFYARFDCHNFSTEIELLKKELSETDDEPQNINETEVT